MTWYLTANAISEQIQDIMNNSNFLFDVIKKLTAVGQTTEVSAQRISQL